MANFLILKLQGPMQAWGSHTYEDYRPSEIVPTRSGILGLLAACLGIERQDTNALLNLADDLEIAVRADNGDYPASRIVDFHTVEKARKVDGKENKNPVVSQREYLCDAVFTVAIKSKGRHAMLETLKDAVQAPIYTPFLGRRSCPLTRPLFEAIATADTFTQAMRQISPYQGVFYSDSNENASGQLKLRDVPLSRYRQFSSRQVYIHGESGNVS